jgi:RNA polymerase sigma-70 factor (ECF subfamily)
VLRSTADAEEIVQETFVEVWRRAGEYDVRRGSPIAWIATIARTRAIDRLRARGARERTVALADPPPNFQPSPGDAAEASELQGRVKSALSALPPEQRRVLELAYFEGLSHSEIAQETGDALGTVKTRVRLGMEKLAAAFAEVMGGGSSS